QSARVGWASAHDGLLVMDRNHDGRINDGRELFGSGTLTADGQRAGHGYAALALEDSNHDGKISEADARFADLRLWVDSNQDGVTDVGELRTLSEAGVVELNLQAHVGSHVDHGNLLGLVSSYTRTDGSTRDMADVWFRRDMGADADEASAAGPLTVTQADVLVDPGQNIPLGDPEVPEATVGAGESPETPAATGAAQSSAPPSTVADLSIMPSEEPHRHLLI
ncbi:MAG TPA: hypothetical protein VFH49_16130, partial [Aquabacterium sp.]|nr:hypothetical protein [Aquabacterium sp.]